MGLVQFALEGHGSQRGSRADLFQRSRNKTIERWAVTLTANHRARNSFSGGIDGRPIAEYIVSKSGDRTSSASSTMARIGRSGWPVGTRASQAHIGKETRRLDIIAAHVLLLPTNHSGMESRQNARSKGLFRILLRRSPGAR